MKTIKIKDDYTAVFIGDDLLCIVHTKADGWPEILAYDEAGELKYVSSI